MGENGTIQLTRTTTLAAYHDGVERYVTSFEFSGTGEEVGRSCRCPRCRPRSSGAATGHCSGSSGGPPAGAESFASPPARRRATRPRCSSRRRSTRSTSPSCAAAVTPSASGRRPRLPAHARRARGPRLLLAAQPDLHGRALRRGAGRTTRQTVGRRHADHADHPDRQAVGAAADPRPRARPDDVVDADVFLLTDERPTGARRRPRRGGDRERPASTSCSTISGPTSTWAGCPTRCGSPT